MSHKDDLIKGLAGDRDALWRYLNEPAEKTPQPLMVGCIVGTAIGLILGFVLFLVVGW